MTCLRKVLANVNKEKYENACTSIFFERGILNSPRHCLVCLIIRTPETINFPFVANGKSAVLGVPVLKHFRVYSARKSEKKI